MICGDKLSFGPHILTESSSRRPSSPEASSSSDDSIKKKKQDKTRIHQMLLKKAVSIAHTLLFHREGNEEKKVDKALSRLQKISCRGGFAGICISIEWHGPSVMTTAVAALKKKRLILFAPTMSTLGLGDPRHTSRKTGPSGVKCT